MPPLFPEMGNVCVAPNQRVRQSLEAFEKYPKGFPESDKAAFASCFKMVAFPEKVYLFKV